MLGPFPPSRSWKFPISQFHLVQPAHFMIFRSFSLLETTIFRCHRRSASTCCTTAWPGDSWRPPWWPWHSWWRPMATERAGRRRCKASRWGWGDWGFPWISQRSWSKLKHWNNIETTWNNDMAIQKFFLTGSCWRKGNNCMSKSYISSSGNIWGIFWTNIMNHQIYFEPIWLNLDQSWSDPRVPIASPYSPTWCWSMPPPRRLCEAMVKTWPTSWKLL